MTEKKQDGTIDMTPSWAGIVNIYIAVLENPDASPCGREAARSEMRRMATIADAHVETQKAINTALVNATATHAELLARIRNPRSSDQS